MAGPDSLEWRRSKAEDLGGRLLERRAFETTGIEVREADGKLQLSGHASITETPYDLGFFTETIARGAFKRTLGENPDVHLLLNHGVGGGLPLARTKSGTLRLSEDTRGLKVDADLDPDDPEAQRLARSMRRGDIDQMSFAFQITDRDWNEAYTHCRVKAVSLHRGDVSMVNQGANPASTAEMRARADAAAAAAAGRATGPTRSQLARERAVVLLAGPPHERRVAEPAGRARPGAAADPDYRARLDALRRGER